MKLRAKKQKGKKGEKNVPGEEESNPESNR